MVRAYLTYAFRWEYSLFQIGRMDPFYSHETNFRRYDAYWWLPFGRNTEYLSSSNRCLIVLLIYRGFIDSIFFISAHLRVPGTTTEFESSGTVLHSLTNIPWIHLSIYVALSKTFALRFCMTSNLIPTCRSPICKISGITLLDDNCFIVGVLSFGDLGPLTSQLW